MKKRRWRDEEEKMERWMERRREGEGKKVREKDFKPHHMVHEKHYTLYTRSMHLYMTLFEYCLIAVRNRVGESGRGTLCPETLVQQDATCTNRK